jgi:hypothetical protein
MIAAITAFFVVSSNTAKGSQRKAAIVSYHIQLNRSDDIMKAGFFLSASFR